MSTIKSIRNQIGISATPTQNFTFDATAADGTMKLARGNAGATTQDIMTVDAAGDVKFTGAPVSKMLLIPAKATTSGTVIDFSSADGTGIPSWAKKISVLVNGVSINSTTVIMIQMGSESGGFEASGYTGSITSVTSSAIGTGGLLSTGIPFDAVNAAVNVTHGKIEIVSMGGNLWAFTGLIGQSNGARTMQIAGSKQMSDVLSSVRLTAGGVSTFDAGSIAILVEGY